MNEILDFIAKHQPVAKATVLDAMGKQIDRLVADGTLVAEMRPTIGGEVLFYSVADARRQTTDDRRQTADGSKFPCRLPTVVCRLPYRLGKTN